MALFIGDSNIVPYSISATSRNGLERKIHKIQLEEGMEYKFISFYYDPDKKEHVGWYYKKVRETDIIKEGLNAKAKE